MKQRNYRFDTAKFFLIWMVILVHAFWSYWDFPANSSHAWFRALLLAYAMPLFSFISGYYIPTDMIKWNRAIELFSICVVFNVAGVILGRFIGISRTFWSVVPVMWYLWVYCACLVVVPMLMKRNKEVGLFCAFLISWAVCLIPSMRLEWQLIGRFCGFVPFFALGAYVGNSFKATPVRNMLNGAKSSHPLLWLWGACATLCDYNFCVNALGIFINDRSWTVLARRWN